MNTHAPFAMPSFLDTFFSPPNVDKTSKPPTNCYTVGFERKIRKRQRIQYYIKYEKEIKVQVDI